jgi:hypothetical protein
MLNKIASISLIITVNILLLSVSVVSHHHHDGLPHFAWENQEYEHAENETDACCPVEEEEICIFEQEIVFFNEIKDDCSCVLCSLHDHPDWFIQAIPFLFAYDFSSVPENLLQEPPYLISYHSIPVSSAQSLRAPPIA